MANNKTRFIVEVLDRLSKPMRRMGAAVDALARKTVKPATQQFKGLRHATTDAGRGMQSLGVGGVAVGNLIAAGASRALSSILELGKTAIATVADFTTFAENSGLAFNALAKHGASGAKLFAHARGLAVEFGMDVQDTTKNFQKLLAAQFNPQLATDIVKMGADLRVIGASAEDVGGALRAITQIKGAGKLMGQELIQLANAGVSIELVREEMGKLLSTGKKLSNLDVLKLQEAGKIDADTAIQGILAAIQKKTGTKVLGEAGKQFADTTITGMTGRLKAKGQDLLVSLGQQMIPQVTKALGPLAARLDAFLSSSRGQELIDQIGTGLGRALEFVAALIEKGIPLVRRFASGFLDGLGPSLPVMADSAKSFLDQLARPEVAEMMQRWGERLGRVLGILGMIGGAVLSVIPSLMRLGDMFQAPLDIIHKGIEFLVRQAATWGPRIIDGLVGGIVKGVTAVRNAAAQVANAVLGPLGKIFKFGSPSKVMEQRGEFLSIGLTRGIEARLPDVQSALDRLAPSATATIANDNRINPFAGPVASSFAERPRVSDVAAAGRGGGSPPAFAPVFHITQQPGESGKELAEDLETRMRRVIEDYEDDLARAVGAEF